MISFPAALWPAQGAGSRHGNESWTVDPKPGMAALLVGEQGYLTLRSWANDRVDNPELGGQEIAIEPKSLPSANRDERILGCVLSIHSGVNWTNSLAPALASEELMLGSAT